MFARNSRSIVAIVLLLSGCLAASSFAQGDPPPKQPAGAGQMKQRCQQMMQRMQQMQERMKQADQRLQEKLAAMKQAKGEEKVQAMADVIELLVQQRQQMQQQRMQMMQQMMGHMGRHMQVPGDQGRQMMMNCPMMQQMQKETDQPAEDREAQP